MGARSTSAVERPRVMSLLFRVICPHSVGRRVRLLRGSAGRCSHGFGLSRSHPDHAPWHAGSASAVALTRAAELHRTVIVPVMAAPSWGMQMYRYSPGSVNVQVKLPPGPISPESKVSAPAGSRTLAACMALDGSVVTAAGSYLSWLVGVTSAATSPLGPCCALPWRPPK